LHASGEWPETCPESSPTFFSAGHIVLFHQLSFDNGVIRSQGDTRDSSPVETAIIRHAPISASRPAESAACRGELSVLGVSIFRV
jgi:hypothetical protein